MPRKTKNPVVYSNVYIVPGRHQITGAIDERYAWIFG